MISAAIRFTQGATVGVAGRALFGDADESVTVSNANNTGVTHAKFVFISTPSESAIPMGVAQDWSTTLTYAFTPDVRGAFQMALYVRRVVGGEVIEEVSSRWKTFGIKEASGLFIPGFRSTGSSVDFSGNARGVEVFVTEWFRRIDEVKADLDDLALTPGPAGPTGPAGAASTVPGPTGPAGAAGAAGPTGPAGAASTVPGPAGAAGSAGAVGATGPAGSDAYSFVSGFTMPALGGGVTVTKTGGSNFDWITEAQPVFVRTAGTMQALSISPTSMTLKNIGNIDNAAVGATIPTGQHCSPGGVQGPTGPAGPTGASSSIPGPTGPTGPAGASITGPAGAVGPTGATGPAGATGGGGGGGYTVIAQCDLAACANQNLLTGGDGAKTLSDGTVISIQGTALCSQFEIINGTGLKFTFSSVSTTAAAYINFANTTLYSQCGSFRPGSEWDFMTAGTTDLPSAVGRSIMNSAVNHALFDVVQQLYVNLSGVKNHKWTRVDPGGGTTSVSTTGFVSDDAFYSHIGADCSSHEAYSGPYNTFAGTWPNSLRFRQAYKYTGGINSLFYNGVDFYGGHEANGASAAGKSMTFKAFRLRAILA